MRKINLIVIHCSATREDRTLTAFDLNLLHRRRGFNGTGYHYYIRCGMKYGIMVGRPKLEIVEPSVAKAEIEAIQQTAPDPDTDTDTEP